MQTEHAKTLPKTSKLSGAVCAQYRRCGKRNCHCRTGEPHGPYFFRFWRQGGKLRKEYVRRDEVSEARAACRRSHQQQAQQRQQRTASQELLRSMRQLLKDMEASQ